MTVKMATEAVDCVPEGSNGVPQKEREGGLYPSDYPAEPRASDAMPHERKEDIELGPVGPSVTDDGKGKTGLIRHEERQIRLTFSEALSKQAWVTFLFVMIFVLVPAGVADKWLLSPRERYFMSTDATISYPGPNEDSFHMLAFGITYAGILVFMLLFETVVCQHKHQNTNFRIYTFIYFAIDLAICMAITVNLTVWLKYYVGRLRPDFLSRCDLKEVGQTFIPEFYNGTSTVACQNQDSHVLKEGRVSYPSGHTSMAFCQGFYLLFYSLWALYVRPEDETTLAARRARGHVMEQLLDIVRCLALFVGPAGALFVGASRLIDYKHHPSDVNAGAMLGIICASVTFFRGVFHYSRRLDTLIHKRGSPPL